MASFILIHGSWHGGWCFDVLRTYLEHAGHEVVAPDLPGMGGDEATLRSVTLAQWADFGVSLCRNATQRPVILAGHSRGGIVVSQAAEAAPDVVDCLVYICAMMLPDGMSRAEFKALEAPNPDFDSIISQLFEGAATQADGEAGRAIFAQLSPPDLVSAAMTRLMAEPHGPRSTPLQLSPERFGSLPRVYIECTQDRTIPVESQRLMQTLVPGAVIETLDTDHSPFLSQPAALAAALTRAAERFTP